MRPARTWSLRVMKRLKRPNPTLSAPNRADERHCRSARKRQRIVLLGVTRVPLTSWRHRNTPTSRCMRPSNLMTAIASGSRRPPGQPNPGLVAHPPRTPSPHSSTAPRNPYEQPEGRDSGDDGSNSIRCRDHACRDHNEDQDRKHGDDDTATASYPPALPVLLLGCPAVPGRVFAAARRPERAYEGRHARWCPRSGSDVRAGCLVGRPELVDFVVVGVGDVRESRGRVDCLGDVVEQVAV